VKLQIADCRLQIGLQNGLLISALAITAACGVKPERAIVEEFFAESRLQDKTALQHTATVMFDPETSGIVQSFEIAKVSPDEANPNNETVTVSAQVKQPGGDAIVQKTILMTLGRGVLKNDPSAGDRWIVTGFIERLGPPATPHP
jgi:hypothetical protein